MTDLHISGIREIESLFHIPTKVSIGAEPIIGAQYPLVAAGAGDLARNLSGRELAQALVERGAKRLGVQR